MATQAKLGRFNRLSVVEIQHDSVSLACEYHDTDADAPRHYALALLEHTEVKTDIAIGDELDVFLYINADDDLIATMQQPKAMVGQCVSLDVVSVAPFGAFLDWGLPNDLLLPVSKQANSVRVGGRCVVYIHIDERTGRVVASTKLHYFLEEEPGEALRKAQQVNILIASQTSLAYKAIINDLYLGLIYKDELHQPLSIGQHMKAWVKTLRNDGKVDLSIHTLDNQSRDELSERILAYLRDSGGRADISDKSAPEEIFALFKVSKRNFKRAISGLYKSRLIEIKADHIRLL